MTRMQFQIACKHCHRTFAIEAESSKTVKCNCPYCGESMIVVTPRGETNTAKVNAPNDTTPGIVSDSKQNRRIRSSHFLKYDGVGKMVTVVFVLLLLGIILLLSFLYMIFSAMSN